MIETELDVLRDVSSRLEGAGISFMLTMNDTSPEIAAIRERLLSRSGAERVVMGSRMFDVARTIALASFVEAYIEHVVQSKTH